MQKVILFPIGLLYKPDGKTLDESFIEQTKILDHDHFWVAVSDRPEPSQFKSTFGWINYCCAPSFGTGSRKSGKFVAGLLELNKDKNLQKSQIVMLGYGEADVSMYANSQTVLIRCDWRTDLHERIRPYGIPCSKVSDLPRILLLLAEEHPWHFTHTDAVCDTYCLSNAATRAGADEELKAIAARLQSCLKAGNPTKRQDFIISLLASLYATDAFRSANLWSYYPSSRSDNTGKELICDFVEMARTTFKCRKKSHPVFIRHTPSVARHLAPQAGREAPDSQIKSIHIHPDYADSIKGKTVVVVDDYTTTGVSFSVASAFLRKAGAAKVLAVAMGKFPRTSYIQEIELRTSPFSPVTDFKILRTVAQTGTTAPEASAAFKRKFT